MITRGLGGEEFGFCGAAEKHLQHFNGHFLVGNHTVLDGVHSYHIAGGSAQPVAGRGTDLQHLACVFVHSHNGGLPDHNTFIVHVDQHIGCAQINA